MTVDPRTGRILGVQPMINPENNEIKIEAIGRILPHYRNCNTLIHDVACQFKKRAIEE